MAKKRFSKDPKTTITSIEDFLDDIDFLSDDLEKQIWKKDTHPYYGDYYKITHRFLIKTRYKFSMSYFGTEPSGTLVEIKVAFRDGQTEYEQLNTKADQLLEETKKHRKSKRLEKQIDNVEIVKTWLDKTKYEEVPIPVVKSFEDYLLNTDYITSNKSLIGRYVVIDVETNGTRKVNDDLLSISLYDPSTGICYNRYLPLDLQPLILTGWIHGITDEDLENATHITQEELNKLIAFFDLEHKTILSFSGGKGLFDSTFIINYCKRHNLSGFENLCFENIKSLLPDAGYGWEGKLTKDNLCMLFGIDGVTNIHSSLNDCVLEWKLFEQVKDEPLFFIDGCMFKYRDGYIVPVSYLNSHPELIKFANISVPNIETTVSCIFSFTLPKKVLRLVKKFPTNITGISLENSIFSALHAQKQDNYAFLLENKEKLQYIGFLNGRITQIPVTVQNDGTLKPLDSQYNDYIDDVNQVASLVTDCLTPVFDFIRQNIFFSDKIISQELSISADRKVLALCDLSDSTSVLEIKTFDVITQDGVIDNSLARQLYYESKGRKTFLLSIDIDQHIGSRGAPIIDEINVKIYHVILNTSITVQVQHEVEIAQ